MTIQQHLLWEVLQETCATLEEGACVYLQHDLFPIIGVVFRDTEADEERWEARLLANGTCSLFPRYATASEAKRAVEHRIAHTLTRFNEGSIVPTPHGQRSRMENIHVFLLAIIDADEHILTVTQYHQVWVAICYNTRDGSIQDYTMMFDAAGNPYCPEAEDFSGHYQTVFSLKR